MAGDDPSLVPYRMAANPVAVVFVHGFRGRPDKTWGKFPALLAADQRLREWDIHSVGYPTKLVLDLLTFWARDPSIRLLAQRFVAMLDIPPLDQYKRVAVIAHSMGGLVAQRALLDAPERPRRVSHLVMFGSPSAGLTAASLFGRTFLAHRKQQISDLAPGGAFITSHRNDWSRRFGNGSPFTCLAVAGERDSFVPAESSLEPFPPSQRHVVAGDHRSLVKPSDPNHMSVQLVLKAIVGGAALAGPWNSARVAVEMGQFVDAIERFGGDPSALDDSALGQLALALEKQGRGDEAIAMLEEQGRTDNDIKGILAGRLKRRWLLTRQRADAERALALYEEGLVEAKKASRPEQALYHGINVAFLRLAFRQDRAGAQEMAKEVLGHCAAAPEDQWSAATEGEAYLLLGKPERALEHYQADVAREPTPRQLESTFDQATFVVGLIGTKSIAARLDAVFRAGEA